MHYSEIPGRALPHQQQYRYTRAYKYPMGTQVLPPACPIEDSAIGFTATAHVWTGLGLFGSAFTPEQTLS
ncbi:hypothetical protein PIB30_026663 [Stylosanthes scabra]|uniref:Uncharacterized protein n=1 Tax=Stylosanthes scabra TaxID=79078 RepID=A0ABU6Z856_9FABA|nr:hypothetical protein [Stylosanthes scabra]